MSALPGCEQAERAVGWAMYALEPADEDVFLAHLPSCHVCRETVRQTEELMGLLASADEREDPRRGLRAELLATVAATGQTPRELREPPLPDVPWGASPAIVHGRSLWHPVHQVGSSSLPRSTDDTRKPARHWRIVVVIATVAFAVIGLGGLAVRQVEDSRQQVTMQAQAEETQRILARATQQGQRHALLKAPSGAPVVVVILDGDQRLVVPVGLVANDTEHSSYLLWGLSQDKPAPLGTFDVTPTNREPRSVGSMPQTDTYIGYSVSIEGGKGLPDSSSLMMIASGQVTN